MTGLRDAHTRYIGPSGLRDQVAVLPFLAEQFGPDASPRYLVSKINEEVLDAKTAGGFGPGVELESWNGMPFVRAVENHADSETGGRPDSRRARALESLTLRALDYGPPPDEDWVIIGYRTKRGRKAEIRLDWRLLEPGKARHRDGTGIARRAEAGRRPRRRGRTPSQEADVQAEAVGRRRQASRRRRPAGRPRSGSGWRPRCRTCWRPRV